MSEITRNKILQIASELFAKSGFDGASIRDIAKKADVNLASINYHFKNKQNLYIQVLERNLESIENEMQEIANASSSVTEFYWNTYVHFKKNSNVFINSFKLFINNNLPVMNIDELPKKCSQDDFNPPGFAHMMSFLNKELGDDIPLYAKEWAARVIFNQVVHVNLILSSTIGQMMEEKVPYLRDEEKKKSFSYLIEAILNFIKENPDKFR